MKDVDGLIGSLCLDLHVELSLKPRPSSSEDMIDSFVKVA